MKEDFGGYFRVVPHKILGEGSYGTVYEGKHRVTGQIVAIKISRETNTREKEIWSKLNHPNLVRLLYIEEKREEKQIIFVMEKMEGDLSRFIHKYNQKRKKLGYNNDCGGGLPEPIARSFLCQLVAGLRYLHNQGIVHRDLKPANILLTRMNENTTLKIADFGFARKELPLMKSFIGSPLYMAPELFLNRGGEYTSKVDIWSAGLIFWQMLTGIEPWREATSENHLRELMRSNTLKMPSSVSQEAIEFLSKILVPVDKRISWDEFCESSYLSLNPMKRRISTNTKNLIINKTLNQKTNNYILQDDPNFKWIQTVVSFERGSQHQFSVSSQDTVSELQKQMEQALNVESNTIVLISGEGVQLEPQKLLKNIEKNSPLQKLIIYAFFPPTINPASKVCAFNDMKGNSGNVNNTFVFSQIYSLITIPSEPVIPLGPLDCRTVTSGLSKIRKDLEYFEIASREVTRLQAHVSGIRLQRSAWRSLSTMIYKSLNQSKQIFKKFIKQYEHYKPQVEELFSAFPEALKKAEAIELDFVESKMKMGQLYNFEEFKVAFNDLKYLFEDCTQDYLHVLKLNQSTVLEENLDRALLENFEFPELEPYASKLLEIKEHLISKLEDSAWHYLTDKPAWNANDEDEANRLLQDIHSIFIRGIELLRTVSHAVLSFVSRRQKSCDLYNTCLETIKGPRLELLELETKLRDDTRLTDQPLKQVKKIPSLLSYLNIVTEMPIWIDQILHETHRRAAWIYQANERAARFESNLRGLWEQEKLSRQQFLSRLDRQVPEKFSFMSWIFTDSLAEPEIKVLLKVEDKAPRIKIDCSFTNKPLPLIDDPILDDPEQLKQAYLLSQIENKTLISELDNKKKIYKGKLSGYKSKLKKIEDENTKFSSRLQAMLSERTNLKEHIEILSIQLKAKSVELEKCKECLKNSEELVNTVITVKGLENYKTCAEL